MAKKQVIRLTESDLRKVIKESVNNILKENPNGKFNLSESVLIEGKLSKDKIFYEAALLVASLALNYKEPKINEMLRKELNKMYEGVTDIEIYFTSQYDFEFIITLSDGRSHSLNPAQIYKIGWDLYMIPH